MHADDAAKRLFVAGFLRQMINGECCDGGSGCVIDRAGTVVSVNAVEQGAGVAVVDGDGTNLTK